MRRGHGSFRPTDDGSAGASAVEYALIVAGIAVAVVAVLGGLQGTVQSAYTSAGAQIGDVDGSPAAPASTSPAPAVSSTSPAPVVSSTSPAPVTSSAAPTPPAGATTVTPGQTVTAATLPNGAKADVPAPAASPARGTVQWGADGTLTFQASAGAAPGPVDITYTYKQGNKLTTVTVAVWIV